MSESCKARPLGRRYDGGLAEQECQQTIEEMIMFRKANLILPAVLAGCLASALVQSATAQTFQYQVNDLVLTLRKNGVFQESYEVVVNLGQASPYVNAAVGTKITN